MEVYFLFSFIFLFLFFIYIYIYIYIEMSNGYLFVSLHFLQHGHPSILAVVYL
jgi:hypothetical protein